MDLMFSFWMLSWLELIGIGDWNWILFCDPENLQ